MAEPREPAARDADEGACGCSNFWIFAETLAGKIIPLCVELTDTIAGVKQKIAEEDS